MSCHLPHQRSRTRSAVPTMFLVASVISPISWASHSASSSLGGGQFAAPIDTESAVPLQRGGWTIGVRSEFVDIETIPADRALALHEADEGADLHRVKSLWSTSLGLAYGATENLTVGFRLPYHLRNDVSEPEDGEIEVLGDSSGFGDLTAFGQYRFIHDASADRHGTLLFGIKTPTGRTQERNANGNRFEAEQQPGSGSWDPFLGLAFSQSVGSTTYAASAVYTLVGEGTQDTDLGDLFAYSTAIAYRLDGSTSVDLVLELNGQWREKQTVDDERERNSGAHQLYLSPGIRIGSASNVSLSLSFGLPLVENFNGDQDELDYRIQGTLSYRF